MGLAALFGVVGEAALSPIALAGSRPSWLARGASRLGEAADTSQPRPSRLGTNLLLNMQLRLLAPCPTHAPPEQLPLPSLPSHSSYCSAQPSPAQCVALGKKEAKSQNTGAGCTWAGFMPWLATGWGSAALVILPALTPPLAVTPLVGAQLPGLGQQPACTLTSSWLWPWAAACLLMPPLGMTCWLQATSCAACWAWTRAAGHCSISCVAASCAPSAATSCCWHAQGPCRHMARCAAGDAGGKRRA